MIVRCLARRPLGLHAVAAAATRSTRPALARSLYTVATLDNHVELQRQGVPGLLTATGFKAAYTDYQQLMLDELNESTAGTAFENQDTKSLVIEFARDPTRAYAFNIASMAFNNHFFFRGLNANPAVQSQPSSELSMQIIKDFSSLDTLRETFLATAESMFGPGFIWLVQTNDTQFGSLRIMPTYLAGSPLSGAHYRRQSHDLNTHNPDSYQQLNNVGSFGSAAKQNMGPKKPLGGIDVVPLMCVNTWEHVWLHDYGIRGKRQYLEAWWDRIDWDLVRQNATLTSRQDPGARQFHYD
ncbi:Fe superoxide dismutase-like protein [Dothidotthia symphoricarpi CBS 119687]|uniref:Fe superoxide dismutase-like protein n=1 Tax=Dothidotthia symphoricarpi CBS 119687 TaxID=1392245 RepID=A0A6A6ARB4_9PLEO|nr:Fe superoxide dismutase-like protein [Dothidotthia symphoricarpi CBS 119687]KAF2134076.1 Fe superoxide dismutase-like protein [Dothidotthia symphoricarpi CBS 119687]